MNPPLPHWEPCESEEEVKIPASKPNTPPTTIKVTVPAWREPESGEIFLDGDAIRILDDVRARHLGLPSADEPRHAL